MVTVCTDAACMLKISRMTSCSFLLYVNKRETLPIKQDHVNTEIEDVALDFTWENGSFWTRLGPVQGRDVETYRHLVSVGEDSSPVSLRGSPGSAFPQSCVRVSVVRSNRLTFPNLVAYCHLPGAR
ncbi:hypothetical protein QTO34_010032 [Cnephaeus nilssonii]|uniref:Uncharacterized protein n=1 Tax=Cnephaeus nilssonii TaxID=3371016 RepID=A0AA40LFF9_CNENI|nr:hypothetical protein QTO34_010032 [Eptesicus nilssonii]